MVIQVDMKANQCRLQYAANQIVKNNDLVWFKSSFSETKIVFNLAIYCYEIFGLYTRKLTLVAELDINEAGNYVLSTYDSTYKNHISSILKDVEASEMC